MTRKDYERIAATLYASGPANPDNRVLADFHRATCEALADMLATDNPRFDREFFLAACGV
jgi:hypothetical protein